MYVRQCCILFVYIAVQYLVVGLAKRCEARSDLSCNGDNLLSSGLLFVALSVAATGEGHWGRKKKPLE
ncbi:hypothetical protein J6590_096272 [Homalodisca vitripennis]|nr:hypothetical protein J6590_096272 [Homalodisca vitripennis]